VNPEGLARRIRVLVFSSGPVMTLDARRFMCRLDADPDIELLGTVCQAGSRSLAGVVQDLWKRRGILAVPLFLLWVLRSAAAFVRRPAAVLRLRRDIARLTDRTHYVEDIHAPDVVRLICELDADLGLVYGIPILREEVFEAPRLGSLGIHHGKVPEYRGNKTTFWAMYNGEEVAGVTIQKINAGLDTGQIVKEGAVPIGRRSRRAVWSDLEQLGLDLYVEAVHEVRGGSAHLRPQTGPKGKLYRNPKLGDLMRFYARRFKQRLRGSA
jgi:folate-dependent phosphoribosylglycinamide formyltransferase PurN